MKQISLLVIIFIAILFPSFSPTADNTRFSIIGKWQTTDDKGNLMSFTFKEDGHYEMTTPEGTQKTDRKAELSYVFDQSKSPMWLDLIMRNKNDERMTLTLKGIVEIIDNDNINMNMGGEVRPTDFLGKKVAAFKKVSRK